MPQKHIEKKQVTYRLDKRLLDCIEGLRTMYPRFNATDFIDLMLKSFFVTHNLANHGGQELMDKAVGEYMRGEYDRVIEEIYEEFELIVEQAEEPSDP